MINKYIYIIGSGRCGTRWLNAWILRHPRCFGGPETHFMAKIERMFHYWPGGGPIPWLYNNEQKLIHLIRDFANSFYSFRQYGSRDVLIDCTPCNREHRDLIIKIFPSAKFVHIYRDGKYFVWSMIQSPWGRKTSVKEWSLFWYNIMKDMHDNPREDQINIKYEDLLKDPTVSRKITQFVQLDHHEDIEPWKRPINTKQTFYDPDKWKEIPETDQKDMAVMNEQLVLHGYEPVKE